MPHSIFVVFHTAFFHHNMCCIMADWSVRHNKGNLFNELYPIRVLLILWPLVYVKKTLENRCKHQIQHVPILVIYVFFGYTLPACLINIERDHNDRP
ncbi:TPA: hypothetical protein JBD00_00165 [Legionella pneumophila subsp. pneumophila]|nr:hypothetical protein [Legionella pneumophila subsp. pneumophila]